MTPLDIVEDLNVLDDGRTSLGVKDDLEGLAALCPDEPDEPAHEVDITNSQEPDARLGSRHSAS